MWKIVRFVYKKTQSNSPLHAVHAYLSCLLNFIFCVGISTSALPQPNPLYSLLIK